MVRFNTSLLASINFEYILAVINTCLNVYQSVLNFTYLIFIIIHVCATLIVDVHNFVYACTWEI